MARTFTASCDKMGIAKLKQDLMAYQKSLRSKNQLFIEELCNLGIPVIKRNINTAQGDSDPAHSTVITISTIGDVCKGTLTLSGKDVLFFEFGAGIYYNNGNAHPQAAQLGYGVGTYPGQRYAINPGYWWYKDDADNLHLSYGTEATMPMLKASYEIISKIRQTARAIYGI